MQGVTDQRQAMALSEAIGDAEQEAERLRERVGAYESQAAERAKGWQDRVSQLQDHVQDRVGKMTPGTGCMGRRSKQHGHGHGHAATAR